MLIDDVYELREGDFLAYEDSMCELVGYLEAVTQVVRAPDVMTALCGLPLQQLTSLPAQLVAWHLQMMVTRLWVTHAPVVDAAIQLEGSFTGSLSELLRTANAITT